MPRKLPPNGTDFLYRLSLMYKSGVWPAMLEEQRRMLMRNVEIQEQRELEEMERELGLDRQAQIYEVSCKPDNSFLYRMPDTAVTDTRIDEDIPKARYHDRVFPKDYTKKKKAKRRAQKQARRKR